MRDDSQGENPMKTLIAIASLGLTLVACDMAPAEAAPV